jgi:hypothetical protein
LGGFAALLLAVVPAVVAGQDAGGRPPVEETKNRLSEDRMTELVAGPMAKLETGNLAAARASFDLLLAAARARHGARSLEVADLYTSFGVALFTYSRDPDERPYRREALAYLEAAVAAYRVATGNGDPELAVALNTYADAQLVLQPDDPPASAEAALDEAYRIRLAALGPTNAETLASLRYLARLRGLPAMTRGDPARIEAVAVLFRRLVADSRNDPELRDEARPSARIAFARMYAQNHMAVEAVEQLRLAVGEARSWPEFERCFFITMRAEEVMALLDGGGTGEGNPGPQLQGFAGCFMSPDESPEEAQAPDPTV